MELNLIGVKICKSIAALQLGKNQFIPIHAGLLLAETSQGNNSIETLPNITHEIY